MRVCLSLTSSFVANFDKTCHRNTDYEKLENQADKGNWTGFVMRVKPRRGLVWQMSEDDRFSVEVTRKQRFSKADMAKTSLHFGSLAWTWVASFKQVPGEAEGSAQAGLVINPWKPGRSSWAFPNH